MRKILSVVLSFGLLFQQSGLVYAVGELNLVNYLSHARSAIVQPDQFRPAQLRYISYNIKSNNFKLLLDKGDFLKGLPGHQVTRSQEKEDKITQETTQELTRYFFIGLTLPNDKFWVNLRPDAADSIIDPLLEKTDIGKIFLESDLQLKKDTASFTSPQTTEGKIYWDKLYQKAGELFGTENITIPTLTRPWIVPNEVIVRETEDSAYIYKATLKVMLEADYLIGRGGSRTAPTPDQYAFSDPRLKELNEYSTRLIRETIIPKLTKEINSSKRYAQLRQVYYSLVLARWFKQKYSSLGSTSAPEPQSTGSSANSYLSLIDSGNLVNLASKESYDKQTYFQAYQKSFKDGEYNLKETVSTPFGQSIRSYISGGISVVGSHIGFTTTNTNKQVTDVLTGHHAAIAGSPLTQQQAIGILNNLIPEKDDQLMLSEQTRQNMFETLINILSLTDKREELDGNTYRVVINFMNGITNGKSVMKDIFASFGSELQKLKASNEPFEKKNVDKLFSVIGKLLLDNLKKSLPREGLLINEKLIKLVQAKQSQPYLGLEQLEAVKYKDMLSAQLEALINELREHLSRYEKDYKFVDGIRDELLLSMGHINGEINKLRDTYYNELGKLLNDIINSLSNYRVKYANERELSWKIPYSVGEWWEKESTDKYNNNRDNQISFYRGLVEIFWSNEKSFEKTAGYIKMIIDAKKVAKDSAGSPVTPREILELAKKEINETNREFQYYRVSHYIGYYERIDIADPFSKEDVIKKLTNEITALQDVIDKSKQNGSQISDVVSFEALRTKNFFKDLRKKLKNSPNQLDETRNSKVKKSGSPLTVMEARNIINELKMLKNVFSDSDIIVTNVEDLKEELKSLGDSRQKLLEEIIKEYRKEPILNDLNPEYHSLKTRQEWLLELLGIIVQNEEHKMEMDGSKLREYFEGNDDMSNKLQDFIMAIDEFNRKYIAIKIKEKMVEFLRTKNLSINVSDISIEFKTGVFAVARITFKAVPPNVHIFQEFVDEIGGFGDGFRIGGILTAKYEKPNVLVMSLPLSNRIPNLLDFYHFKEEVVSIYERVYGLSKAVFPHKESVLEVLLRINNEIMKGEYSQIKSLGEYLIRVAVPELLKECKAPRNKTETNLIRILEKVIEKTRTLCEENGVSSSLTTIEGASPEIAHSGLKKGFGGIDLTDRMLNMQIERVGSFASSTRVLPEINNVEALDLDKEFEQIQAMVSSSIRPSDIRILEFAAACYYKGEFDRRLTQVSSCIKAAHLADELLGKESSPALRLATMLPDALYGG